MSVGLGELRLWLGCAHVIVQIPVSLETAIQTSAPMECILPISILSAHFLCTCLFPSTSNNLTTILCLRRSLCSPSPDVEGTNDLQDPSSTFRALPACLTSLARLELDVIETKPCSVQDRRKQKVTHVRPGHRCSLNHLGPAPEGTTSS